MIIEIYNRNKITKILELGFGRKWFSIGKKVDSPIVTKRWVTIFKFSVQITTINLNNVR